MLTSLFALSLIGLFPFAATNVPACSESALVTGGCGITNNGTSLTVTGERTDPGTPGTSSPIANPGGPQDDGRWLQQAQGRCEVTTEHLLLCPDEDEVAPDTPAAPALPSVTITDLAQFAPDAVTPVGEPDNVGVAGMPTNFVATASVHTRTGSILGFPLTVRFTPSGYDFHYGDGTSASTATGGQSWAALGQPQFTPTATSHTYQARGTYAADVDVRYTAEVDFGLGWTPIDGELTTDGPTQEIRIFEAHTALVAHTCQQRPASPGC